jgi:uncharacterized protein YraI
MSSAMPENSTTQPRRFLRRLGSTVAVLAMSTAMLAVTTEVADAATGRVNTAGANLTIRSGPHTTSTAVGSLSDGESFTINCQTYGDSVSGTYGTSKIWDHVSGQGGYVSDAYVYTGSDAMVAPLCGGTTTTCANSFGNPNTCLEAANWAINHEHTGYDSAYYRTCDHLVALAYGWGNSGSTTAYVHWTQIPSTYRHAGVRSVPIGGLSFFSNGGSGHVMISIGNGKFVSNDIHGNGTYTETTISEIESKWGQNYLGWAQPWFKVNH